MAQYKPAPPGRTRATLNNPRAYRSVRTTGAFVPTYVSGRLTHVGSRPPGAVAVAINGQVAATSPTFRTVAHGSLYYAALVPVTALRPGANQVQLFAVSGSATAPRLGAL